MISPNEGNELLKLVLHLELKLRFAATDGHDHRTFLDFFTDKVFDVRLDGAGQGTEVDQVVLKGFLHERTFAEALLQSFT